MAVQIEKIGKVSAESVHKGTGRHWTQWIAILEKAGGRGMTHKELVALLKKKYRLSPWWQQGVATGFEMHIGRKAEGRNEKGEYSTMASRTFPVGNKKLWNFLESEEGLALWLKPMSEFAFEVGHQFEVEGGVFGEVRTFKKFERARLRWQDEEWLKASVLQLYLIARSSQKSILVFQHDKLPSERSRLEFNERWKGALNALLEALR